MINPDQGEKAKESYDAFAAEWNKGRKAALGAHKKGNTLRVAILAPGQSKWVIRDIPHNLKGFQSAVGGLIEHISSGSGSFELYVNEDQGPDSLLPPCAFVRSDPLRIFHGPIVAFGAHNAFLDFELPITPESLAIVEDVFQPVGYLGEEEPQPKASSLKPNGDDHCSAPVWVENNGPIITYTNFWDSALARSGRFYVSTNSGCIRVLLPDQLREATNEMEGSEYVIVTQGKLHGEPALELLWEDHSNQPYFLVTHADCTDRTFPDLESGRKVEVAIYTSDGLVKVFPGHFRVANLPCLRPL